MNRKRNILNLNSIVISIMSSPWKSSSRAYFKMLTYSKIKEILPHAVYNRKEKKFDLYLDVKMKEEITVGFGGNVSSYQANQLFLGLGYQYFETDMPPM